MMRSLYLFNSPVAISLKTFTTHLLRENVAVTDLLSQLSKLTFDSFLVLLIQRIGFSYMHLKLSRCVLRRVF